MRIINEVKALIRNTRNQERWTWEEMLSHSTDYIKALRLREEDLEVLERSQGNAGIFPTLDDRARHSFIQFDVGGETFTLYVAKLCGAPYGGTWQMCILAVCTSNSDLNIETGRGTTHITVIPRDWHEMVMRALTN